ncbi:MAG: hypothetical protein ACREHE_05645 [Rhizomicrobium sp.]
MRSTRFLGLLGLAVFAAMVSSGARAEGTLTNNGTYSDGSVKVDLDDYTDGPSVVALMGMKSGSTSISFAWDSTDWPDVLKLWNDARAMTGSSYATAGSLREVGSSAQAVITFAGGPAVRVTIVDPTAGALIYTVQPGDEDAFGSALEITGNAATKVN